jgi:CysZ protein
LLRARLPLALGFGLGVFVCFLVPLGAVLLMPAAVAGGTLLAREVLGLPTATRGPA